MSKFCHYFSVYENMRETNVIIYSIWEYHWLLFKWYLAIATAKCEMPISWPRKHIFRNHIKLLAHLGQNMFTKKFIVTLSIVAKNWKQYRGLLLQMVIWDFPLYYEVVKEKINITVNLWCRITNPVSSLQQLRSLLWCRFDP